MRRKSGLAISLILVLVVSLVPSAMGTITAKAEETTVTAAPAEIKLSRKKVTLEIGESYQLEVEGTEDSVKWKSKKKAVATVTKDGTITAKKEGKTNVIATIDGQKYKCQVRVVRPENPYLEETSYVSEEYYIKATKSSVVIPEGWIVKASDVGFQAWPDLDAKSFIQAEVEVDESASQKDYEMYRMIMEYMMTPEMVQEMLQESVGETDGVSFTVAEDGVRFDEVETPNGKAMVMEIRVDATDGEQTLSMKATAYMLLMDGMTFTVTALELDDPTEEETMVKEIAMDILNSFVDYK